jgi:predicted lipoprotein with Yx(FWY)xxD motif
MRTQIIHGCLAAAVLALAGCGAGSSSSSSYSTASGVPAAGGSLVVSSKQSPLGTILAAGPRQMTVYMFAADTGSSPTCTGACAEVWPPVTSAAGARASGQALAGELGTVARSGGTMQITYKGHPLYYYRADTTSAEVSGQDVDSFGARWYVLSPAGVKLETSAPGASEPSSSSYKY